MLRLVFVLSLGLRAAEKPAKDVPLKTDEQKTLYALGMVIGRNVAPFSLAKEDLKFVTLGLRDSLAGQAPQVDMSVYGPKIQDLQKTRLAVKAEAEKKRSKEFLAKAAKDKGARVLPSGLVFTEVKPGRGDFPGASDAIKAHYQGALINGTIFDSSYRRGEPTEFSLGKVIACWKEGLQMMRPGGKARLVCPPDLAYGDAGNPPRIPGGAALVFDVELLDVVKK